MFLAGLALIAFEVASPGAIFPGAAGGLLLTLSLFGISILPFTWVGLLLLLLGAGLLIAEINVGHGALGAVGVVAFAAGAFLLFDSDQEGLAISTPLVIGTALVLGACCIFIASRAAKVRRLPPATGLSTLIGRRAEVREALDPEGLVFVHGELWAAVSDGEPVPAGAGVVIERLEGFTLHVHPAPLEEVRS